MRRKATAMRKAGNLLEIATAAKFPFERKRRFSEKECLFPSTGGAPRFRKATCGTSERDDLNNAASFQLCKIAI